MQCVQNMIYTNNAVIKLKTFLHLGNTILCLLCRCQGAADDGAVFLILINVLQLQCVLDSRTCESLTIT